VEGEMSRTIGHNRREYEGWKMIQKAKKDRKYGRRDHVKVALKSTLKSGEEG
jgi:hypothetical protein